jgi:hypothetical protein
MEVTLEGIVIDVKPLHPSKALAPMEVTREGIETYVRLVRFLKDSIERPITV